MLDVMYDIPSNDAITTFTITRELVELRSRAKILPYPGLVDKQESA